MTEDDKDRLVHEAIERALSPVITEMGLSGIDVFVVRNIGLGIYRRTRATSADKDDPDAGKVLDEFVVESSLDMIKAATDYTVEFNPRKRGN